MEEIKRRVLIAMDGSAHSSLTFQWYLDNLYHKGDEAVLVWNVDAHPATFGTVNLMAGDPDVITKVMHEQTIHSEYVMKSLEQMLADVAIKGRVVQLHGQSPGAAIIDAANNESAHLIICGSRGLGTFRRTFLGSVSDYILHHAHVPVVICRFDNVKHDK